MKISFFTDIFQRSKGVILGSIAYFAYTPILANLVGPEIFGEFQFIYQISYFSSLLVSLRVEFYILRFNTVDADLSKLRSVLIFNTVVLFILSLIAFKDHNDMLILLMFMSLFNVFTLLEQNLLITQKKIAKVGNSEFVMKATLIIFSYIAFILDIDIRWALPIAIFAKLLFLNNGKIKLSFNKFQDSLNLFIFSVAKIKFWFFSQTVMTLTGIIPLFLIADSFGKIELGYYTLMISVLFGAAKILSKSIADVIMVSLRSLDKDLLQKFTLLIVTSLLLFLCILYVNYKFGEKIISYIMNDEWLPILDIFHIVLIWSYFAFLSNSFDRVVTFTKFSTYPLIFNSCRFISTLLIYIYSVLYNIDFVTFLKITTWVASSIYLIDVILSYIFIRYGFIKHGQYTLHHNS